MAAFTGSYTGEQYARQIGSLKADPLDGGVKLRTSKFNYTHPAGDNGTGTIPLGMLPAGLLHILPDLCRLVTSQFGAAATLSIGTGAYVRPDGTAVAAVPAALHSVGAAGSAALDAALGVPADGAQGLVLESRDGVPIIATVASGDIQSGNTIQLRLIYGQIG